MVNIVRVFKGPPVTSFVLAELDSIETAMQLSSKRKKKKMAYVPDKDVVFVFYGEKYLTIIINKLPEYSPYYAIGQHMSSFGSTIKLRYQKTIFGEINTHSFIPSRNYPIETSLLRTDQEEFRYNNYEDIQSGNNYFDMQKDISGVVVGTDGYVNPDGFITTSTITKTTLNTGSGRWISDSDTIENLFNFLYSAHQYFNNTSGEVSQTSGLLTIRREHIYSIFYNLIAHMQDSFTFYDYSESDTFTIVNIDDFFNVQSAQEQAWFNLDYFLHQDIFHKRISDNVAITASLLDYIDVCRSITLRKNISNLIKISVDQLIVITEDNTIIAEVNINIPGFGLTAFDANFAAWLITTSTEDFLLQVTDTLMDLTFTLDSSSTRTAAAVTSIQASYNNFIPQVGDVVHVESPEGWAIYNSGVLLLPTFDYYITGFINDAVPLTSGDPFEDRFYGFDPSFNTLHVGMFDRVDGGNLTVPFGDKWKHTNFIDTFSTQYSYALTTQGLVTVPLPFYRISEVDLTETQGEDKQYGFGSGRGTWLFNDTKLPWTTQSLYFWNSVSGTYINKSFTMNVNEYLKTNQQLVEQFTIFYSLQGETYQYQYNNYFGDREVSLRKSNSIITDTFALTTTFPTSPVNPVTFDAITNGLHNTLGLYPGIGAVQRYRADNANNGNISINYGFSITSSFSGGNVFDAQTHFEIIGIPGLIGEVENTFDDDGNLAAHLWDTGGHHMLSGFMNGHSITVYLLNEELNTIEYCTIVISNTLRGVLNQYTFWFREMMEIIATHHDPKLYRHLRLGKNINTFVPETDENGDYLYKISDSDIEALAFYYGKKQAVDAQLFNVLHNGFMSYQMISTFLNSPTFMDSYYIIKQPIAGN